MSEWYNWRACLSYPLTFFFFFFLTRLVSREDCYCPKPQISTAPISSLRGRNSGHDRNSNLTRRTAQECVLSLLSTVPCHRVSHAGKSSRDCDVKRPRAINSPGVAPALAPNVAAQPLWRHLHHCTRWGRRGSTSSDVSGALRAWWK